MNDAEFLRDLAHEMRLADPSGWEVSAARCEQIAAEIDAALGGAGEQAGGDAASRWRAWLTEQLRHVLDAPTPERRAAAARGMWALMQTPPDKVDDLYKDAGTEDAETVLRWLEQAEPDELPAPSRPAEAGVEERLVRADYWCPQCGVNPDCDEDGCCSTCGATVGPLPAIVSLRIDALGQRIARLEQREAALQRLVLAWRARDYPPVVDAMAWSPMGRDMIAALDAYIALATPPAPEPAAATQETDRG